MNKLAIGMSLLVGTLAFAKGDKKAAPPPAKAKEVSGNVESKSGSKLTGKYTFSEKGKEVMLKVTVEGAAPGDHAVHIHETADCSDPDGKKAGGHWNPAAEAHGAWASPHHHMGDIGNMKVGADGKGTVELTTDKWTIGGDAKTDVTGHAIVVHEKVDDFTTQPTGNAGNRIGCGVIAKQ